MNESPSDKTLPPTEQLIADLLAAHGVLRVPAWPSKGERDYRALVGSAQRFGKVPTGKRLTLRQNRDELEIRLEDAIEGTLVELRPVPVPARLSNPHAAAKRFRDHTDFHEVSRNALPRATRIVHGLAVEAERRGMSVANVDAVKDQYGNAKWSGGNDGHLTITVRDHRYRLRIAEEKVPSRSRWEREQQWRSWTPDGTRRNAGRYDANATGRLTISLLAGYSREGRSSSWSDRKNWTLEDKLPELLRELEVRAAEDDHAALEAERAAKERQRLWQLEIEQAKARFLEAHRAKVLQSQIAAWQEAETFRQYLALLKEIHDRDPEAAEWIAWVERHIERFDPLHRPQRMPEEPEIAPEDLKPFLPSGVNPHGPSRW